MNQFAHMESLPTFSWTVCSSISTAQWRASPLGPNLLPDWSLIYSLNLGHLHLGSKSFPEPHKPMTSISNHFVLPTTLTSFLLKYQALNDLFFPLCQNIQDSAIIILTTSESYTRSAFLFQMDLHLHSHHRHYTRKLIILTRAQKFPVAAVFLMKSVSSSLHTESRLNFSLAFQFSPQSCLPTFYTLSLKHPSSVHLSSKTSWSLCFLSTCALALGHCSTGSLSCISASGNLTFSSSLILPTQQAFSRSQQDVRVPSWNPLVLCPYLTPLLVIVTSVHVCSLTRL